ncbi:MAG: AAA family ATPase, partial [Alphaproteobacteria bacterium]
LDFSTLEKRHAACENEVRLNRRTAPKLYLGVEAVERQADGELTIGAGRGEVVDWLVKMRRFPDDALLGKAVGRGALTPSVVHALADVIAAFHQAAAISSDWGGADELARIAKADAETMSRYVPDLFDPATAASVAKGMRRAVEARRDLLESRRANGFVRHGHGDLHLANIYLDYDFPDGGRPTLFDAIEFDDRLAQNDVLYDLAFLLMDLWHRGLRREANAVFNRYLLRTGDLDGLGALPLFLSLRAGIRAHVTAAMAAGQNDDPALRAEAVRYLDLAAAVLRPPPPVLVAVGGFSGSGKSHLAATLAPLLGAVPGALHLRSDELRKVMLGVDPETGLGKTAYTAEISARVYGELRRGADRALKSGQAVIADAVHNRPDSRTALAALARQRGVPFIGLWLDAEPALMADRIARRRGDASDADGAVMRRQLASGAGKINWHRLDAAAPLQENLCRVQALAGAAELDLMREKC